jgi:hypothetical protein
MIVGVACKTNTPTIIFIQTFLEELGIKRSSGCYKCVVDGWPLVAVVGCNSIIAIKLSGKCWIDGKGRSKKL